MATIIDASYFIGDIEIPNTNQEEILTDVNNSIALYEKEVLIALLGYPLYKELMQNLSTTDDKWSKLLNGEDFSFDFNGVTIETRWEGLKGLEKKSLIAYYVYWMHRRKRQSYNAGVGIEVEAATDNSKPSSLYEKLVYIWNEFVKMYGGADGEDPFVSYSPGVGTYGHDYETSSAFNYLLAKKDDFPTWRFTPQGGEINRFGI